MEAFPLGSNGQGAKTIFPEPAWMWQVLSQESRFSFSFAREIKMDDDTCALQDPRKAYIYPPKSQCQRFQNGLGLSGRQISWSHRLVMGKLRCTGEKACPGLASCVWAVPSQSLPISGCQCPLLYHTGDGQHLGDSVTSQALSGASSPWCSHQCH